MNMLIRIGAMDNPGTGVFHGSLAMHARTAPFWTAVGIIAAWSCLLCQPSHAAVEFYFDTDQDVYTVLPGGTVDVDVFLFEKVTSPDLSRLVAEDGLSMAQVTIERMVAPPGPAVIGGYAPNLLEFDDLFSPIENWVAEDLLDITQMVDIGAISGPTGVDLGGGVRRVYLLTMSIQGGSAVGDTTFSVYDNPLFDETLTFDLLADPLDPLIQAAEFTVSTIPEPSTLTIFVVLGILGAAVSVIRRRRLA